MRADARQDSRVTVAVARSRRCGAIANRECSGGCEQWFLLQMSMRRAALLSRAGRSYARPEARKRAPQAASESQVLLCHSERSEESFPLRTKGRGRTMPRKEEKDKRSAVKNLSTYTFIQILRRSMTSSE